MARCFSSDKTEWMPSDDYARYREAEQHIAAYMKDYHHQRGHSDHNYLSPAAAEQQAA